MPRRCAKTEKMCVWLRVESPGLTLNVKRVIARLQRRRHKQATMMMNQQKRLVFSCEREREANQFPQNIKNKPIADSLEGIYNILQSIVSLFFIACHQACACISLGENFARVFVPTA